MLREQRSTYLSRSALLRGGSSHPRPFRGRPFARSDDLLAVLRVAVHFAHTRLGRHGILRIGSGELYVRGKLAPDELQLLLLRIRAIEEAEGVAVLKVLAPQGVHAQICVAINKLDEAAAVRHVIVPRLPFLLGVSFGGAVVTTAFVTAKYSLS